MRVLGSVVARNEADRYLGRSLAWLKRFTDDVFVFDDRSTDGSVAVAVAEGCAVRVRGTAEPSFLDDESAYRATAWRHLEEELRPRAGDWVLVVDADEFPVAALGVDEREALEAEVDRADRSRTDGLVLHVDELFGAGPPALVRTDGLWGSIEACRMVRWRPDARFASRRMGASPVPSYVTTRRRTSALRLPHLGYATDVDRRARYRRYTDLQVGHNRGHVASILAQPTLTQWVGKTPWVDR